MPHMKLIVPKKLSKKAYKKAVAEVSAEWDKRLAVLNEPSAAERLSRPKVTSLPSGDQRA